MKTSMHLKVAAIIAHVALCTAIVIEAAEAGADAGVGWRGAVPVVQPVQR